MAYIHLYKNNPTAGGADGSRVSEGTELNSVSVTLNAARNEISSAIALALRCETGYNTSGDTVVDLIGTNADKVQLSLDGITWLDWGASLTITSVIGVVNTLFYARVKAVAGESAMIDVSVDLSFSGNTVEV